MYSVVARYEEHARRKNAVIGGEGAAECRALP